MKSVWIDLSILLLILVQSAELKGPGHKSLEHLDIWHECIHDEVKCPLFHQNYMQTILLFLLQKYTIQLLCIHIVGTIVFFRLLFKNFHVISRKKKRNVMLKKYLLQLEFI